MLLESSIAVVRRHALLMVVVVVVVVVAGALVQSQVSVDLTDEDRVYINKVLDQAHVNRLSDEAPYEEEVRFIVEVQAAVLNIASKHEGIPESSPREPKNVYLAKKGLCYDRSRVIEKALLAQGFKVRHVSIYEIQENGSSLVALLTPGVSSHAVTEVLTSNGWLVVDSNDRWVSLGADGKPVSMKEIQRHSNEGTAISWKNNSIPRIYKEPFTYVYGLYSRHGRFYPPFNFIPDVNYQQFFANFI